MEAEEEQVGRTKTRTEKVGAGALVSVSRADRKLGIGRFALVRSIDLVIEIVMEDGDSFMQTDRQTDRQTDSED